MGGETPTTALHHTIHALVTPDETIANLPEAVEIHLEGEDLEALGLAPQPAILAQATQLVSAEKLPPWFRSE